MEREVMSKARVDHEETKASDIVSSGKTKRERGGKGPKRTGKNRETRSDEKMGLKVVDISHLPVYPFRRQRYLPSRVP